MALTLVPTKVISDALAKGKRYARKFNNCQDWSPAKRERMLTGRSFTFVGRIYKGLKFKSGGESCAPYADKALEKLAKAQETFEKYKTKKDWGPQKKKKLRNDIAKAEKYIHKKLGLTGAASTEAKQIVASEATLRAGAWNTFVAAQASGKAPPSALLPSDLRERMKARMRARMGEGRAGEINNMTDAELLAADETLDAQDDAILLGDEGMLPELSVDGITDWVSDNPIAAAGVVGSTAFGLWFLFGRK